MSHKEIKRQKTEKIFKRHERLGRDIGEGAILEIMAYNFPKPMKNTSF